METDALSLGTLTLPSSLPWVTGRTRHGHGLEIKAERQQENPVLTLLLPRGALSTARDSNAGLSGSQPDT